jgi:superfamily I DNA and RNA helicase
MVVFPNIRRQAYCHKGFQWLIPSERALFQDDLDPAGGVSGDPSGKIFRERISECLPFRFKGLTENEFALLTDILGPLTRIELPHRHGEGKDRFLKDIRSLDEAQATLAMQLGRGHQIIKGPPGSGKTLVLIHRCGYLYKYHPRAKRILFVCYNIALVGYIKQLLRKRGIQTEEPSIQVFHFFELCSSILKEPVHFENEDFEYYNRVIEKTLKTISKGRKAVKPFDAIFIDEAQDFNGEMLSIIMALHKPGGDLVIALDSFQDLYKRKRSWKSLGIQASGRTRALKRVYRNTEEIKGFSQRFIGEKPDQNRQLTLLPKASVLHGDVPLLCRFPNHDAIETFLANDIKEQVKKGEYKRSEIAIIYDDKIYGSKRFTYDNRAIPMGVLKKLESAGIPTKWVSQDVRTKEMFEATTDKVSLISIHSSKGLDFDLVYLIGVDHISLPEAIRKDLITLVYVAMTRAKHRLVIPYVHESALIHKINGCLY